MCLKCMDKKEIGHNHTGVNKVFGLKEEVMIVNKKRIVGFGVVTDICKTRNDLRKYFHKSHPHFSKYMLSIKNNEHVFIVDFKHDLGRAGYLKKELRKRYKQKFHSVIV